MPIRKRYTEEELDIILDEHNKWVLSDGKIST